MNLQELMHGIAEMEAVSSRLRIWSERLDMLASSLKPDSEEDALIALASVIGAGPDISIVTPGKPPVQVAPREFIRPTPTDSAADTGE